MDLEASEHGPQALQGMRLKPRDVHLELRQLSESVWDLEGEALNHGLLDTAHVGQCILLHVGHLLLHAIAISSLQPLTEAAQAGFQV